MTTPHTPGPRGTLTFGVFDWEPNEPWGLRYTAAAYREGEQIDYISPRLLRQCRTWQEAARIANRLNNEIAASRSVVVLSSAEQPAQLCECRIAEYPGLTDRGGDAEIIYCPLHAEAPAMLAFIRRVACEPIGPADATASDIFTTVEAEARALLAKIEGDVHA